MKFPATQAELLKGGYVFSKQSQCQGRDCRVMLRWYKTAQGRFMPLSVVPGEPGLLFRPHFIDCVNAQDFRKGNRA